MTITKRSLPKNWHWTKLIDVCEIIMGQSPPGNTYRKTPEGMPFFQGKADFGERHPIARTWCIAPSRIAKPGDILLSVRAPVGPTNIADVESCIGRGLAAIRSTEKADRDFVLFALKFYENDLVKKGSGSTFDAIRKEDLFNLEIPLPPLDEQKRIAAHLDELMRHSERARQAVEEQLSLITYLVNSYFRESLQRKTTKMHLSDCMVEVKKGVGETWAQYPVLGATRSGVAPAKEKVGKQPQRYKLVEPGTIFYNPMRIMIGSIAMLDDGDESGITSPDYVVLKGKEGILHPRWFYYWFRSPYGENFIKSLARGAVRERMLFNRLDKGEIELPDWKTQVKIAEKLKEIKTFKQALEAQLAEINELPSALLRQAFAGQL